MEREEWRREIIVDQSEKIIVDFSKQSRLEQAARNEDIRVGWIEHILKEIN